MWVLSLPDTNNTEHEKSVLEIHFIHFIGEIRAVKSVRKCHSYRRIIRDMGGYRSNEPGFVFCNTIFHKATYMCCLEMTLSVNISLALHPVTRKIDSFYFHDNFGPSAPISMVFIITVKFRKDQGRSWN